MADVVEAAFDVALQHPLRRTPSAQCVKTLLECVRGGAFRSEAVGIGIGGGFRDGFQRQQMQRLHGAVRDWPKPLGFLWALEDPVATTNVLDGLRELRPSAPVIELPGLGHYPQLEDPDTFTAGALQLLDEEQKEAADMDGASALSSFIYITLPHLARPITVVILIETIFLLTVFAEIFVTTGGGPGLQTTNIAFLIYSQALVQYDIGNASAGGLVAVVIANIVAFFLVRIVGRNLEA